MAGRLEKLIEQRAQLDARIRDMEARRKAAERKADTRRKILAGALVLEHADINPAFGETLRALLARGLTRPHDRALFGLPEIKETFSEATESREGFSGAGGVSQQPG